MATAEPEPNDRSVRRRSYHDKSYRTGFLGAVSDFQKAGVLQDVVLEVEGRRFPCHRLVLSAASPYFRAMFTSDMAESRQKTVVLQGLDPAVFAEILSYIYSGTLHVSLDKVQPLYQAADLLQVDYVRETCTSYMAMNVERSTCLDLYKFSDTFSVGTIKDCCLQCICRHFAKVSTTAEFCSLSVDQLTDIIRQDGLDVKQETTVWEAVVRWVEHSKEERWHHLPSILQHVRFNLLTSDDKAAILEHPLVKNALQVSEVTRNAVQVVDTSNLKARAGMDKQEMAFLFSARTSEMLFINPRSGRFFSCYFTENLESVIAATVTSNNDIYILAELCYEELSLFLYNYVENGWEYKSMVANPRRTDEFHFVSHEYLVEINGQLHYFAVLVPYSMKAFVVHQKYNQYTDHWQECSLPQLASYNQKCVVVPCRQHLYYFTNTEMHRYDATEDRWCRLTPPNAIPSLCTAVAIGTEVFCTDNRLSKLAVYEISSDSWRMLPGLPSPESSDFFLSDLFVLEDKLYIVLTSISSESEDADHWLLVYDQSTGDWKDLNVTLPHTIGCWRPHGSMCGVACMYMAYMKANCRCTEHSGAS